MNYWFLYNINDGSIYGSPYLGDATEWTNIPEGCNVIGFIYEQVTDEVKEAFEKPLKYKIFDNKLVVNDGYVEPNVEKILTLEDRVIMLENLQLQQEGIV